MTRNELALQRKGYVLVKESADSNELLCYAEKHNFTGKNASVTYSEKEQVFRLWFKEVQNETMA